MSSAKWFAGCKLGLSLFQGDIHIGSTKAAAVAAIVALLQLIYRREIMLLGITLNLIEAAIMADTLGNFIPRHKANCSV